MLEISLPVGSSVAIAYSNLDLNTNEFDILDAMIKTDNSVNVEITDPANADILTAQKTEEYKLFTITTQPSGILSTIKFTFTSTVPTIATVDYIGLRTNRIMDVSSSKISMRRED